MEVWQIIVASLVSLTILITFVVAGIGNYRQAGNRAVIAALESTSKTQEVSLNTLRGELADVRAKAAEEAAERARGEAAAAKRDSISAAKIAELENEVKNLQSQRTSIGILEDISVRLDTYYEGVVKLIKATNAKT